MADEEFAGEAPPDPTAMVAWFSSRAGSVSTLGVFGSAQKLPGSLLAMVLVLQATSLRELYIHAGALKLSGGDLAALVTLTALENLTIHVPEVPDATCWDDHGAAVIKSLLRLPDLRELVLDGKGYPSAGALPTVCQLAALQSPTLSVLYCSMASSLDGTLALGALPALVTCELCWITCDSHLMHVTAASFSGAQGITQLTLKFHNELQLEPLCFSTLGMLANISLRGCGLTAVPTALAGVQRTLQLLNLSSNNELQIDQAGFDTLLALSVLTELNLSKPESFPQINSTRELLYPSMWTGESVRFMSQFHSEWQRLRPRAAVPRCFA